MGKHNIRDYLRMFRKRVQSSKEVLLPVVLSYFIISCQPLHHCILHLLSYILVYRKLRFECTEPGQSSLSYNTMNSPPGRSGQERAFEPFAASTPRASAAISPLSVSLSSCEDPLSDTVDEASEVLKVATRT